MSEKKNVAPVVAIVVIIVLAALTIPCVVGVLLLGLFRMAPSPKPPTAPQQITAPAATNEPSPEK
jgi:hypothetical protein